MVLVYLSGPIIHSDLRKNDFFRRVKELLEKLGHDVFAPQFLPYAEPEVIFSRDVDHVRKADALIGEVSNPSLGVGMELMLTIELHKPLLLFRQSESRPLSKMVLGAPNIALFEYTTLDEVNEILRGINLNSLKVRKCPSCPSEVVEDRDGVSMCVRCKEEFTV